MSTLSINPAALLAAAKSKKDSIKQHAKTIKCKDGANRFVILPGWLPTARETFFHDYGQHFVKSVDGTLQAIYVCLDKTHNTVCPVCDALGQAASMAGTEEQVSALAEAKAGQTYLLNVLELDGKDTTTPQILQIGKLAFGAILDLFEDWGEAMFDTETPQIVQITREGKGIGTKYAVQISAKKHAINAADVYSKLNNLSEYVKQESDAGMKKAVGAVNNIVGLSSSAHREEDWSRGADVKAGTVVSSAKTADVKLSDDLDSFLDDLDQEAS